MILIVGCTLALFGVGAAVPTGPKVLLVEAEGTPTNPLVLDVKTRLEQTSRFSQVDVFNASTGTPTLAQLQEYDSVLVWSDSPFADRDLLGNRVDSFVRAGGRVVIMVFAQSDPGVLSLGGTFESLGDCPVTPVGQSQGTELTLGLVRVPDSYLMAGVSTFDGGTLSFHNPGPVTAGSTDVADYSNGVSLVATRAVGSSEVVALNFWPPSDATPGYSVLWKSNTDGTRLMANALVGPPPPAVPSPAQPPLPNPFPAYNLNLSPQQLSATAAAGSSARFTLTVTNLGRVADTYTLSLGGTRQVAPSNLTLQPGYDGNVTVVLDVPADLAPGSNVTRQVTATSSGQPDLQVSATVTAVAAGPQTFTQSLRPGWNALAVQSSQLMTVQANPEALGFEMPGGELRPLTDLQAAGVPVRACWVYARSATILTYAGSQAPTNRIPLLAGWNLVGFPGDAPVSVPLAGQVTGLVELQPDNSYRTLDPTQSGLLVIPGRAYWVYAPAATELVYP